MSDNKRIAKNTAALYIRMIIVMGVTLYTSRVVLDKLGVDDYGLYNAVCGIAGLLAFTNNTLASGTLRFFNFEMGKKIGGNLSSTFNTAFYTHLGLALIVAIGLETVGLWFVYNKMVIPPGKLHSAIIAYHLSIITLVVTFTQVPYTSLIIAHERMAIYSYVSIIEAVGKLAVAYMLSISHYDKLIIYAVLLTILQIIIAFSYRFYCRLKFPESLLKLSFNKDVFRSMMGFSGWNLIAFFADSLKNQGYLVLLNLFFQPFVVAAQTIANQVTGAMMQFIQNFRTAINPQIIKSYAAEDYEESKQLTLSTTVLTFDLVMLLGLPCIFTMKTIMSVWLVEVPEYAVIFTQCIIAQRIIGAFSLSLYTPLVAAAKLRENAIWAVILGPGLFVVIYLIFKFGGGVMWFIYVSFISVIAFSFLIKPYLLVKKIEGYNYRDLAPCFLTCFKVALLSIGTSLVAFVLIGNDGIVPSIVLFFITFISVAISSYVFLEKAIRQKMNAYIRGNISRVFHK